MESISYEQVQNAICPAPPREMIDLFNQLNEWISGHPQCILDEDPFDQLNSKGNFCISATSIQSKYIAFVLGKHSKAEFPSEMIAQFFEIENSYKLQYGTIPGKKVDGCICLIHQEEENFDLADVYRSIYS